MWEKNFTCSRTIIKIRSSLCISLLNDSDFYFTTTINEKSFNFHKIKYNDFELAFHNTKRNSRSSRFRRNSLIYELDIELKKDLLKDYIYSKNTSLKYRMIQNPLNNCYWGVV